MQMVQRIGNSKEVVTNRAIATIAAGRSTRTSQTVKLRIANAAIVVKKAILSKFAVENRKDHLHQAQTRRLPNRRLSKSVESEPLRRKMIVKLLLFVK